MLNFYVLITLICWGVWGILDKKALGASTNIGVLTRLFSMSVWQCPLCFLFMYIEQPGFHISSALWMWAACAAIARSCSFGAYLLGMSMADASLVLGVTAAYPIVTQLIAVAYLHEPFVVNRMAGAIAIVVGLFAIGFSGKTSARKKSLKEQIILWGSMVVATIGWGIWGIFDKVAVAYGTVYEVWLAECTWEVVLVVIFGLACVSTKAKVELRNRVAWVFVFLSSVCLAVGKLTYLSALKLSSVSYVITITACYPVLMYALAVVLLREKFDLQRFIGIVFVVGGGIAVQLSQS